MMKLYDELYIGIPSGIRITGCVVGKYWTTVRIDGNVGVARTMELPDEPEKFAASFIGRFLRDVAGHLYWPTMAHASIGVASMNAWYNTRARAEGLDGIRGPEAIENAVVISSDALITRELPKLLDEAGESANVILEGCSLPLSPLFFSFGMPVREIRGFYPKHIDTLEACAVKGIKSIEAAVEPFCVRAVRDR